MNRALEAVEDMPRPGRDHLEAQVIVVAANFTGCHDCKTISSMEERIITVSLRSAQPHS